MIDDVLIKALADTTVAPDLQTWRRAHPNATLTEIERELDARLAVARADLLAEIAAELPEDTTSCPRCGTALVRRGERTRTVRTTGDASVVLTRADLHCPACGTGLFPPR